MPLSRVPSADPAVVVTAVGRPPRRSSPSPSPSSMSRTTRHARRARRGAAPLLHRGYYRTDPPLPSRCASPSRSNTLLTALLTAATTATVMMMTLRCRDVPFPRARAATRPLHGSPAAAIFFLLFGSRLVSLRRRHRRGALPPNRYFSSPPLLLARAGAVTKIRSLARAHRVRPPLLFPPSRADLPVTLRPVSLSTSSRCALIARCARAINRIAEMFYEFGFRFARGRNFSRAIAILMIYLYFRSTRINKCDRCSLFLSFLRRQNNFLFHIMLQGD